MSKWLVLIVVAAAALISLDLVDASCKRHDRKCCRQKIRHGSCHSFTRRWAFNVSCGRCVPFEYSGCDGDDNNFYNFDDCNSCCHGTRPCPHFSLPVAHRGCNYRWHDGPDFCSRPRLECHHHGHHHRGYHLDFHHHGHHVGFHHGHHHGGCERLYCRHDSCRHGHRCVARHHDCHGGCHGGCRQFECISDPCFSVHRHFRPCERCVALPSHRCDHSPCPLVAFREDHCSHRHVFEPFHHGHHGFHHGHHGHHGHHLEFFRGHHHRRHCAHFFEYREEFDSCRHRRCHAYPHARCILDPCDCRKHWWTWESRSYSDIDCGRVY